MRLNNVTQHVQCVRMTSSAIYLWINFISAYKIPKNARKLKKIIKL